MSFLNQEKKVKYKDKYRKDCNRLD